jgi:hypothetical protein
METNLTALSGCGERLPAGGLFGLPGQKNGRHWHTNVCKNLPVTEEIRERTKEQGVDGNTRMNWGMFLTDDEFEAYKKDTWSRKLP